MPVIKVNKSNENLFLKIMCNLNGTKKAHWSTNKRLSGLVKQVLSISLRKKLLAVGVKSMTLHFTILLLPGSEANNAQRRIHIHTHTQIPAKQEPSIFLWTENIFSQHGSLVETSVAAGSSTVDGNNEQERVSQRYLNCSFISRWYTSKQVGAYTNKRLFH